METLTEQPKTRLPMAEAFFAGALASQSLAHGYILKGKAWGGMYNMALEIAKILNCRNRPVADPEAGLFAFACGECKDCRWIAQNAHPAVLTISRFTYQVDDKGGDLDADDMEKLAKKGSHPTQIKAEQIERLLSQLGLSSEHTRVVIFTDAEELPANMPSEAVAPYEWRSVEANEDKSFHIRPLERKLFNHASANRFLKTLEEPPPHTLFFFIAESEEQLLETIVSRCQVVPCLSDQPGGAQVFPPEYGKFLENLVYRIQDGRDVYALAGEFQVFFTEEAGLSMEQGLEVFQSFLRQRYLSRLLDEAGFTAYRKVQEAVDSALRMLASKTNENQSLIQLFITLSRALPQLQLG